MPNFQTYLDISIGGSIHGRVIFDLFDDVAPRTVENFVGLCTGSYGVDPCSKVSLHYKGCKFFRVIPGFICQSGDIENNDGTGGRSIYGPTFADESYLRRHAQAGVLSMANTGKNTNQSQFFITLKKAPQLSGRHVVFGQVVGGMNVVRAIEKCPTDYNNVPRIPIIIEDCGLIAKVPKRNLPINQLRDSVQKLMSSLTEDSKSADLNLLEQHAKKLKEKLNANTSQMSSIQLLEAEQEPENLTEGMLEELEKLQYKSLVEQAEEKAQLEMGEKESEPMFYPPKRFTEKEEFIFDVIEKSVSKEPKNILSHIMGESFSEDDDDEEAESKETETKKIKKEEIDNNYADNKEPGNKEPDNKGAENEVEIKKAEQKDADKTDVPKEFDLNDENQTNDEEQTDDDEFSTKLNFEDSKKERLYKLRMLLNESRNLNAKEVAGEAESHIKKPSVASEKRHYKKNEGWNMNDSASTIEFWDNIKRKKEKNVEKSFGWNAFTDEAFYKAHKKRTADLTFNPDDYAKQILQLSDKFYDPTSALVSAEFKPSEHAKNRLVNILEKDKQKRSSFRRRRMYIEEENVQYINNFNRSFNEKLERAFGKYSLEIKQNLERGTAL